MTLDDIVMTIGDTMRVWLVQDELSPCNQGNLLEGVTG